MPVASPVPPRRRRVTGIAMVVAIALQLLAQAMPVAASISPTDPSLAIPPGGSDTYDITVDVPAVPPKADILIAIDTTGSMGTSIAQAKADATAIVSGVQEAVDDSEFAVVEFRDLGDSPEYEVQQGMTDDAAAVQTAIDGLTADGGGDNPEAHNLVFQNSYDPDTGGPIGWRSGTKKIVVVISDAEPHGAGSVVPDLPGCSDITSDPHALNTAAVLTAMDAADRTLIMVRQPGPNSSLACYQSIAAVTTGGIAADGGASGLGEQIVDLINNTFTGAVADLHVAVSSASPSPAVTNWVTVAPASIPNVPTPSIQDFVATVSVPLSASAGTYTFGLVALADGVDIGQQTLTVNVAPAVTLSAPQLVGVVPLAGGTDYFGVFNGAPGTAHSVNFFSTPTCTGGTPGTLSAFGTTLTITPDANGSGVVIGNFPGPSPSGYAVMRTSVPGGTSPNSNCVAIGPANDVWPRALGIGGAGNAIGVIDQPGQARWYKFAVQPGQRVTVTLTNLPQDYDLALFNDIGQAYQALSNPTTNEDLTKLGVEFAGTAFSGTAFSGTAFSGTAFSGTAFSGTAFSGTAFSGTAFSGTAFSGTAFSGTAFSGTAFSGTAFSSAEFSGTAFSGTAFSAAASRSVIVASANPGTGSESVTANTWNNSGSFYVAVFGKNGVSDIGGQFTVSVSQTGGDCGSVGASTLSSPAPIAGDYRTIIFKDSSRLPASGPSSALNGSLSTFKDRTDVDGVVVDLANDPRVQDLNDQADDHPTCAYAKNLVAEAIRDVVQAYRSGSPNLTNVVILGNDDVIPFFRNPDRSDIAQESAYDPPVDDDTASQASLRGNYVLSQDAYGARIQISQYTSTFAIPDLAVGRLVETAPEIIGMLDAYIATNGIVTPDSSLVTGYDFLTDAANQAQADFVAGTGGADSDSLITPGDWTADELRDEFLDTRHDIAFLAGHFSASAALAGDFETTMTTTDLTGSPTDLSNMVVFSIGCHSGYNLVDGHAVPGVSQPLDWAQAFAQKQMTGVLGTGYQYGDTDFIAYSEQLYTGLIHRFRVGTGPVSLGRALVDAKLDYLRDVPELRGLHEKVLREATLFGLPMLRINLPQGRNEPPHPNAATLGGVSGYPANTAGGQLGLQSRTFDVDPDLTVHHKTLIDEDDLPVETTWYSGANGIVTNPGEPAIPLVAEGVGLTGSVLRGVGFLGGDYNDLTVVPLTGAPGTEANGVHTAFTSPTFFPSKLWTPNYYEALSVGGAGTRLLITPAQHQSPDPGDPNVTLRKYDNLHLRLYYSSSTEDGAGSDAPTITAVTATVVGSTVQFSARVVGDPRAGVQESWITYTGLDNAWHSLALTQSATDSALWTATLNVTLPASLTELDFMVQAVNGFGLVGRNDNLGAYHKVFLQSGGAPIPGASSLSFTAAPDGAFGSTGHFSADLDAPNQSGQTIKFTLGGVSLYGLTNSSGVASVDFPLNLTPGSHPVSASFLGSAAALGSSTSASINVNPTGTSLSVGSSTAPYLTETGVIATLTAAGGSPLAGRTVIFGVTGPGGATSVPAMTDPAGVANLGIVNLPAGAYSVTANFGGDGAYAAAPTASGSLTIVNAVPAVTGVAPGSVGRGASAFPVTITGSGFVSGATVTISGTGVSVTSVEFLGPTSLKAFVSVTTAAPIGARNVSVTNPGTAAASCTGCLSISQGPYGIAAVPLSIGQGATNETITVVGFNFVAGAWTPASVQFSGSGITINSLTRVNQFVLNLNVTVSPTAATGARSVTVINPDGGRSTALAAFTINAAPTITTISPTSRPRGALNQSVVINGTNFRDGTWTPASVSFSGAGVTVNSVARNSSTKVTVNVSIAQDAALTARDITVRNTDYGRFTKAGAFSITAGPGVASLNPPSRPRGASNQTILITGSNFQSGSWPTSNVSFSGTGITVNSVTRTSATLLTVKISISSGALAGARDVTVRNVDGGRRTLAGGFTVNLRPAFSSTNPVSPSSMPRPQTNQTVLINGAGFAPGATVAFSGGGITVGLVTVNPAGTQLTVKITISGSASKSSRNVTITNTDGGTVTLNNGFRVT